MTRKNLILTLLLCVTILVIAFVRYVIKKDNTQTLNVRLGFYSEFVDTQYGFIDNTLKQTADHFYSSFISDPLIVNYKVNSSTDTILIFNNLISRLLLSSHNGKYSSDILGARLIPSLTKNQELQSGFSTNGHSIFYFVQYLISNEENDIIGILEIYFDSASIKQTINNVLGDTNIGLIYVPGNLDEGKKLVCEGFKRVENNGISYLWNNVSGKTTSLISSKHFSEKLVDYSRNNMASETNFSFILGKNGDADVITLKRLDMHNSDGELFWVTTNNDQMIVKTRKLNTGILIFNIFIVLIGMLGITYLFLNRIHILQQKHSIQKSEQKLKELNQSKDKFFSIVAHDLKNPFNGIMGMSGYLCTDYENIGDDERKEIINDINISSRNAFNLLQNLLEWTRAQSGVIRNNPEILDPGNTIELALETVTNLAKNKEIEIIKQIDTKSKGWADENLLTTVIRNLTTNAVKYSPRKSTIVINVREYKNELVFCVADNGVGLQDDEIDKLFRIDVTFHKLGTEKETGTGLGLKICKEFVEYCGGKIWVVSQKDQGCKFYFTTPKYITS